MKEVYYKGKRYESQSALAKRLGLDRSAVSHAIKYREMLHGAYVIRIENMLKAVDA